MRREVRLDVIYPHPPERVWKALADRKALAKWLLPNDFLPRLGHRFRFVLDRPGKRERKEVHCQVVELDAPHRLAYTWRSEADAPLELVSWTLEPVEAGTRLRLEHIALEETAAPFQSHLNARFDAQWQRSLLSRLPAYLRRHGRSSLVKGRVCLTRRNEFLRWEPAAARPSDANTPSCERSCEGAPHFNEKVSAGHAARSAPSGEIHFAVSHFAETPFRYLSAFSPTMRERRIRRVKTHSEREVTHA